MASKPKATYIAIDTETGGLYPQESSLLTMCMLAVNENFEVLDELDLGFKPPEGGYKCHPAALAKNKINLQELEAQGVTLEQGRVMMINFLEAYCSPVARYNKIQPLGHNIPFDLGFLWYHLIPQTLFESYLSYHVLDTVSMLNIAKIAGIYPRSKNVKLETAVKVLGVVEEGEMHVARTDIRATVQVAATVSKILQSLVQTSQNSDIKEIYARANPAASL